MTLQSFIENYGYFAVLLGTFLEGETVLVMAGFAAFRGYLDLPLVIAVAFAGSFLGDQLYFLLGQHKGVAILARYPRLAERATHVQSLLHKYHTLLILVIRFLYGLRIVGPVAIGMSGILWHRFLILNMVGAAVWAVVIGTLGYFFGSVLELLIADIRHYEEAILGFFLLAGLLMWAIYRWRNRGQK
ncbi:DedA family protein [Sulfurirhabdus autotrophica]|uniref:Membrane protein DedA with SNARE-associated domain n=1 Tax=Sulfurirhabdus autotrophica TaxID=1706046 RepID=A0A4R3Y8Q5_9PROT|nr:DedA family protein [Sulfurirhabdus autotrophica]TCV88062.1 membrane protein DedA with SNARE-associated domain [Sulfurirhabdus autotrophica]